MASQTQPHYSPAPARAIATPPPAPPAPRYLAVRRPGRIDLIALDDVVYAQGADKYSELVRSDGRRHLHDRTLSGLASLLPADFVRIHKSFLVRFDLVTRLHVRRGSRYSVELRTGHRLPVGRSHYVAIKERLLRAGGEE